MSGFRFSHNLSFFREYLEEIVIVTTKQTLAVADDFVRKLFPELTPDRPHTLGLLASSSVMTNAYSAGSQGELVVLNNTQIEDDNRRIANASSQSTQRDALRLATIYRDPQDVRTVIHLARSGIVLTLLLLTSIVGNFYQYYRRPDRIVVDKSSGRVVEINDRDYGETEAVELGPERLTDADKKYIASEFVKFLYQIDPATRSKDLERALRMMVPDSALKFARYLKQDNVLDKQLQESWQSTWTSQDITVDLQDRYTVRVLGRQDVHRLDNGITVDEPRQLSLTLKLIADPKGRADRNLRSGFIISAFDYKEIQ